MKRIEDRFQEIVHSIIEGTIDIVTADQKSDIDSMFALWYMRARYRSLDSQEIQLNGVEGVTRTKVEEENLEKNSYLFVRSGGQVPARQINGIQLQMRINAFVRDLSFEVTRWGIIRAQTGEFIVPDIPSQLIIPLAPNLALVGSAPDGLIIEENVASINSKVRTDSHEYYFARDLSACPF
jgi:hypothetical protein